MRFTSFLRRRTALGQKCSCLLREAPTKFTDVLKRRTTSLGARKESTLARRTVPGWVGKLKSMRDYRCSYWLDLLDRGSDSYRQRIREETGSPCSRRFEIMKLRIS